MSNTNTTMSTTESIVDESDLSDTHRSSTMSSPPARRVSFNLNTMDPEDWLAKNLAREVLVMENDESSKEESSVSSTKEKSVYAPTTAILYDTEDYDGVRGTRGSRTSRHNDVEQGEDVVVAEYDDPEQEFMARVEGRVVHDDESVLIVDGEVTQEVKNRKVLIMVSLGVFVVISLIVLVVALSTLAMNRNGPASPQSGVLASASMNTTDDNNMVGQNNTPELSITTILPNQTIADGFLRANTSDPGRSLLIVPIGRYILDLLRRPGINMTVFGLTDNDYYEMAKIPKLIAKVFQPSYSGHILDAFERLIVEKQSSSIDDLYDGMVLISRNGYSIQVEVDGSDIRVNGVSLHARERNMHYSNGYLHNLANFPFGFGKEWLGKSNYDVLLETNEKRGGDLSRFIELIDATDNLKASLMDESSGPMTVFCFVNDALSEASWRNRSGYSVLLGSNNGTENDLLFVRGNATSTSIDPSSELYQMLLNHIISKNFVRHIWTMIPGGQKVSDTELRVVTSARQVIDLVIEPGKPVVINGEATVIQEDILSEQGVVHVLNRPLYLH